MSLETWVNDEMHSVFGYSDRAVGSYVISLAKKSSDPNHFIEQLQAYDDTVKLNATLTNFATQLLSKVPRAGKR